MEPSTTGSFRIFRIAGIDVFLHWSWFAVAYLQIVHVQRSPDNEYSAFAWKVAEYLTLFGIVLLHEFGHALACRQVGGRAERIVLWPLGGIAYVSPPPRPGAVLWSIAAGPLVNLLLVVPTVGLWWWAGAAGWESSQPDLCTYLKIVLQINLGLLVFNLLPIYPLDGGQVLQALLWFAVGRWTSLLVVSIVGGILGVLGFLLAFLVVVVVPGEARLGGVMFGLITAFVALRSYSAFRMANYMLQLEGLPRHVDCACPACHENPPCGRFWLCEHCTTRFDTFATRGKCPGCGAWYLETGCPHCHTQHHIDHWFAVPVAEEALEPIVLPAAPKDAPPS